MDNHNAPLKVNAGSEFQDLDEEESTEKVTIDIGVKRQQFSNEKLLEDELTARIESGMPAFGMNLKIYKRKGEYGRQYIIPVGRLDLLCEDSGGNLYVIELKKDSGYDDPYRQTAEYLDWFEHSEKFKDRKVIAFEIKKWRWFGAERPLLCFLSQHKENPPGIFIRTEPWRNVLT